MEFPDDFIDKIICGDCLEVMKDIPDRSIDMILADLPYGTTRNRWDIPISLEYLWIIYKRILKSRGIIALTASQPFSSMLVVSNLDMFKHEWIWQKNRGSNFANTVREPMKEHDHILIFGRGKWTYNKQMEVRKGTGAARVKYDLNWTTQTENYGKFNGLNGVHKDELRVPSSIQKFNIDIGLHPTQKPVKLFEYLIRTYTETDELVLDNVIGSGTTAEACIRTGRHFIGIDISEKYCQIARNRITSDKTYYDK